jgi:hypothetical protein
MSILDKIRGWGKDPKPKEIYSIANSLPSDVLSTILIKAFTDIGASSVWDEPEIKDRTDWNPDDVLRRAIDPISNYFNSLGIYRTGFIKSDNDDMALNTHYSIGEKALLDYMSILNWTVKDDKGKVWDDAVDFLERPNPQQRFSDVNKIALRDLMRYDAGVLVKTYYKDSTLAELKPYLGTEFWKEIDRVPIAATVGDASKMIGYWSHGYIQKYWQRSRTGVYISYDPDEICYMSMYKQSGDIYGTDYISRLKYQIQYLIDSTRAAGRTFQNGVVPSLVWSHPNMSNNTVLQQRISEIKAANQGSYKFGSVMHLINEEQVSTLAKTLHDMEWLEGQKYIAQLIWAMWGFTPDEFISSDTNRATAYIGRNITKSKMLYPIVKELEWMYNHEILPKLEGWSKDKKYKFSFIRDTDYDDELKVAQINATKAQTFSMLRSSGIAADSAISLSGLSDDPSTVQIEEIPIGVDANGNPNAPKQPVKNRAGAIEGNKGSKIREIPFGDKEERQAGVK